MILTYYTATTMIIIAYLLGSIPSAVWIGKKYYGIDIREYGSKNAGTTNMLRVLGKRAACLLTISDSFVSPEITTAEQRQTSFTAMMKVALGVDAFLEK